MPPDSLFDSLTNVCAFSPRDWSKNPEDAWIYGIVCGWGSALREVGDKFGWTAEHRRRLIRLRLQFAALKKRRTRTPSGGGG